jgi:hypothetical protein
MIAKDFPFMKEKHQMSCGSFMIMQGGRAAPEPGARLPVMCALPAVPDPLQPDAERRFVR